MNKRQQTRWSLFQSHLTAFYKNKLEKPADKLIDIIVSALFTYCIHLVIHALLIGLSFGEVTGQDKGVHRIIGYLTIGSYFIYVFHLLIPDASEQIAKSWDQVKKHWKKK